jgi:hypothetical protein
MDIENLKAQIKLNCDISDAQFWGHYSICGLLMRLRELYRNEKSLTLLQEIPKRAISEWIASREAQWKSLENENLRPLEIDGRVYDPFEVDGLNAAFSNYGFVYGAGYTMFSKPTFFLARLCSSREIYDYRVYYAGQELCRDLSAPAAMLQGRCIYLRFDSLKTLLWDKLQQLKGRKFGGLLEKAFSFYGIEETVFPSENLCRSIETLSNDISELFILHEVGEAVEDEHSDEWLGIINNNTDRGAEFYMRGIKDLLSDTSEMGPLKYIINKKERPLLNFYMVFLDGIRKELFPEIMNSFHQFVENGDWALLEEARKAGYRRARELREYIIKLWEDRKTEDIRGFIKQYMKDSLLS